MSCAQGANTCHSALLPESNHFSVSIRHHRKYVYVLKPTYLRYKSSGLVNRKNLAKELFLTSNQQSFQTQSYNFFLLF